MNESSSREESYARKKELKITSFLNSIQDSDLIAEI